MNQFGDNLNLDYNQLLKSRLENVASVTSLSAATYGIGAMVWETNSNQPYWSDGANWITFPAASNAIVNRDILTQFVSTANQTEFNQALNTYLSTSRDLLFIEHSGAGPIDLTTALDSNTRLNHPLYLMIRNTNASTITVNLPSTSAGVRYVFCPITSFTIASGASQILLIIRVNNATLPTNYGNLPVLLIQVPQAPGGGGSLPSGGSEGDILRKTAASSEWSSRLSINTTNSNATLSNTATAASGGAGSVIYVGSSDSYASFVGATYKSRLTLNGGGAYLFCQQISGSVYKSYVYATSTGLELQGDLKYKKTDGTFPSNGQVPTADGAGNLTWATPSANSPLTTKGDIYTYSNTNARLGLGSENQILSVSSAETTGLKWIDKTPLTTKGDLYTRGSSTEARLGVGSTGQLLTPDSSTSTGLKWSGQSSADVTTGVTTEIDFDYFKEYCEFECDAGTTSNIRLIGLPYGIKGVAIVKCTGSGNIGLGTTLAGRLYSNVGLTGISILVDSVYKLEYTASDNYTTVVMTTLTE